MDATNLWSQFPYLHIRDGLLLRHSKNQGPLDDWQVLLAKHAQRCGSLVLALRGLWQVQGSRAWAWTVTAANLWRL